MSLASRLIALAQAVGADVKALTARLDSVAAVSASAPAGSSTGVAANALAWSLLPVGTPIVTSTGTADEFERQTEGSILVKQSGWYTVTFSTSAPAIAADVGMENRICAGPANTTPLLTSTLAVSDSSSPVPSGSITYIGLIPANTRIALMVANRDTVVRNNLCFSFGITRSNGPKGDPGTSSAFHEETLTGVTSYTIAGLDGDLDYGYEFYLMGSIPAGTVARYAVLVPNALVVPANAALKGFRNGFYRDGAAATAENIIIDGIGLMLCPAFTISGVSTLNAKATLVARVGTERVLRSEYEASDVSTTLRIVHGVGVSKWTDTTTKITSLRFLSDGSFTGKLFWRKMVT